MRVLLAVIAIPPALAAQEDRGQDPREAARRYIEYLADEDPAIRKMAVEGLKRLGKDAVPALEKLLEAKGALEVYRILQDIDGPRAFDPRWPDEKELPTPEILKKDLPKIERSESEKYVHARFAEAVANYHAKNYHRAYELANALLVLEPSSRYAEEIRKLRRLSDTMITQESLLKSQVVTSMGAGVVGERLEFRLRMENVFKGPVKVSWGNGAGPEVKGYAVVHIVVEALEPHTMSTTMANRDEVLYFDKQADIAMGGQWELTFGVDTSGDFEKDTETLRRYTIWAWTQPSKIETGYGNQAKRLTFTPARVFVVPKKYEHLVEDPVGSLKKAMELGNTREVFMAAMLAPSDRRDEVAGMLVEAIQKAQPAGRITIGKLLTFVTDQRLGDDPKAWKEWWEGRSKRK
jgi:hypothetical protein